MPQFGHLLEKIIRTSGINNVITPKCINLSDINPLYLAKYKTPKTKGSKNTTIPVAIRTFLSRFWNFSRIFFSSVGAFSVFFIYFNTFYLHNYLLYLFYQIGYSSYSYYLFLLSTPYPCINFYMPLSFLFKSTL